MRVADRLDDARRHLLARLVEMTVDAGHNVIERRQHLVVVIELAVGEDVALGAFEDLEAL